MEFGERASGRDEQMAIVLKNLSELEGKGMAEVCLLLPCLLARVAYTCISKERKPRVLCSNFVELIRAVLIFSQASQLCSIHSR